MASIITAHQSLELPGVGYVDYLLHVLTALRGGRDQMSDKQQE